MRVVVDSADLDDADARELRARVAEVGTLADRLPTGRADGRRVELDVEPDEGERRTTRFDEHDAPASAGSLLRWVLGCPQAVQTVAPAREPGA